LVNQLTTRLGAETVESHEHMIMDTSEKEGGTHTAASISSSTAVKASVPLRQVTPEASRRS